MTQQTSAASELVSAAKPERKRPEPKVDRELYDKDIHWLLNVGPVELGEKSSLGGQVSTLERGGASLGLPNTDLYDDEQLGWGKHVVGTVERWRRLNAIWDQLSRETRGVLSAHYLSKGRAAEVRSGVEHNWESVSGALGQVAQAAVFVLSPGELAMLVKACMDTGTKGRAKIINEASKRVTKAVREAHRAWSVTRELMGGRRATPAA